MKLLYMHAWGFTEVSRSQNHNHRFLASNNITRSRNLLRLNLDNSQTQNREWCPIALSMTKSKNFAFIPVPNREHSKHWACYVRQDTVFSRDREAIELSVVYLVSCDILTSPALLGKSKSIGLIHTLSKNTKKISPHTK